MSRFQDAVRHSTSRFTVYCVVSLVLSGDSVLFHANDTAGRRTTPGETRQVTPTVGLPSTHRLSPSVPSWRCWASSGVVSKRAGATRARRMCSPQRGVTRIVAVPTTLLLLAAMTTEPGACARTSPAVLTDAIHPKSVVQGK